MNPIMTVEFRAHGGNADCLEESVPIHTPEELMAFIAPGGGCEKIPVGVAEIIMNFLPAEHRNTANPLADHSVSLQMGMIVISGPLSEVVEAAQMLLDRAGRNEVSGAFMSAIGCT